MKKVVLILCMVVTLAVAAGLIFIMVMGINGTSVLPTPIQNWLDKVEVNVDFGGNNVVVQEERVYTDELQKLILNTSSHSVDVRATNDKDITIRLYAPENSDDRFTVNNNDGTCRVDTGGRNFTISIGIFFFERRVEIDIPRDWTGDVEFSTQSGSMKLNDDFIWDNVTLHTSSGSLTADGSLTANSFTSETTSGSVKLTEVTAETAYIKATSGSVKIGELTAATTLHCTSGSLKVDKFTPTGDSSIKSTSGSVNVAIPDSVSFNLDVSTTSGSISTGFDHKFDSDRKNHATAIVGGEPRLKLDVNVHSGSVKIAKY
ncbi:hypothetical protein FACS1894217_07620 [Clostridia bacterium]|nr:hypothetical protein FACS1894217_07620 [Clostridia bacterium]